MIIELLSLGVIRLRHYERILIENWRLEGVTFTNHSTCFQTMINLLSCGIRMWAQVSFVLSQITLLTDGQKDRRTDSFIVT